MTEHLNREQNAADRANHSVHRVPDGIHPWNFISKKLEEIENTGDGDYPRVREDFERLILWRESNPVKMDCESGDKNCQIKIDAGQRGETERDGEQVKLFHARNICVNLSMSRAV